MINHFTDATNPDVETRKHWIALAEKFAIPIRCVYLTSPAHICQHNNAVRAFGGDVVRIPPSLLSNASYSICGLHMNVISLEFSGLTMKYIGQPRGSNNFAKDGLLDLHIEI